MSRLETMKRVQSEIIAAVVDDLREMARRAYKDSDPRTQEVLALNQLYKPVYPDLKYQCKDCKTLTEAVEVLESYEVIMADSMDNRKPVRMLTKGNSEEDCETVQALGRQMASLETYETYQ